MKKPLKIMIIFLLCFKISSFSKDVLIKKKVCMGINIGIPVIKSKLLNTYCLPAQWHCLSGMWQGAPFMGT
jgi:hypothetical protein